jgi:hypothetical protein
MIPVEGHKNLYRDPNSLAIINCDDTEYNNYIRNRQDKARQKKEIEQLKNDVNEIKELLKDLINESKRN